MFELTWSDVSRHFLLMLIEDSDNELAVLLENPDRSDWETLCAEAEKNVEAANFLLDAWIQRETRLDDLLSRYKISREELSEQFFNLKIENAEDEDEAVDMEEAFDLWMDEKEPPCYRKMKRLLELLTKSRVVQEDYEIDTLEEKLTQERGKTPTDENRVAKWEEALSLCREWLASKSLSSVPQYSPEFLELVKKLKMDPATVTLQSLQEELRRIERDLETSVSKAALTFRKKNATKAIEMLSPTSSLSAEVATAAPNVPHTPQPARVMSISPDFAVSPPRVPDERALSLKLPQASQVLIDPLAQVRDDLDLHAKQYEYMNAPDCPESTLVAMIAQLLLQRLPLEEHAQFIATYPSVLCTDVSWSELFHRLRGQLNDNPSFLSSFDAKIAWNEVVTYLERSSTPVELKVKLLRSLLFKFMPLNVFESYNLVQQARERVTAVDENAAITLVVGKTHAGKSTTILFSAGLDFAKIEVPSGEGSITHYHPVDTRNRFNDVPNLKTVVSSCQRKSETRFVNPITFNAAAVDRSLRPVSLTLCDAAGFGDTDGAEVDIANAYSILQVVQKCSSVKFVAVLSHMSIGDTGEGILELVQMLAQILPVSDSDLSLLDSIVYVFTKCPENRTLANINGELESVKRRCQEQNRHVFEINRAFGVILDDMIFKTKNQNGAILLDILSDDSRIHLLDSIIKCNPIRSPQSTCAFSTTPASLRCAKDQMHLDKARMVHDLDNNNLAGVIYRLENMKRLNELLNDNMQASVDASQEQVCNYFVRFKRNVADMFLKEFQSYQGVTSSLLDQLDTYLQLIEDAKILNFLDTEAMLKDTFAIIRSEIDSLWTNCLNHTEGDLSSYSISIMMNLKRASKLDESPTPMQLRRGNFFQDLFDTYANSLYHDMLEILTIGTDVTLPELKEFWQTDAASDEVLLLEKCVSMLEKCVLYLNWIENSSVASLAREKFLSFLRNFIAIFESGHEKFARSFQKSRLTDIDNLKKFFRLLCSLSKEKSLVPSRSQVKLSLWDRITTIFPELTTDFSTLFAQFKNSLCQFFQSKSENIISFQDNVSALNATVDDLQNLQDIPELSNILLPIFQRLQTLLMDKATSILNNVRNLSIDKSTNFRDLMRIVRPFYRYRPVIDKLLPGHTEEIVAELEMELDERFRTLDEEVSKLAIHENNLESLRSVLTILANLRGADVFVGEMRPVGVDQEEEEVKSEYSSGISLLSTVHSIEKSICDRIRSRLIDIDQRFSLELIESKHALEQKLLSLTDILNELYTMQENDFVEMWWRTCSSNERERNMFVFANFPSWISNNRTYCVEQLQETQKILQEKLRLKKTYDDFCRNGQKEAAIRNLRQSPQSLDTEIDELKIKQATYNSSKEEAESIAQKYDTVVSHRQGESPAQLTFLQQNKMRNKAHLLDEIETIKGKINFMALANYEYDFELSVLIPRVAMFSNKFLEILSDNLRNPECYKLTIRTDIVKTVYRQFRLYVEAITNRLKDVCRIIQDTGTTATGNNVTNLDHMRLLCRKMRQFMPVVNELEKLTTSDYSSFAEAVDWKFQLGQSIINDMTEMKESLKSLFHQQQFLSDDLVSMVDILSQHLDVLLPPSQDNFSALQKDVREHCAQNMKDLVSTMIDCIRQRNITQLVSYLPMASELPDGMAKGRLKMDVTECIKSMASSIEGSLLLLNQVCTSLDESLYMANNKADLVESLRKDLEVFGELSNEIPLLRCWVDERVYEMAKQNAKVNYKKSLVSITNSLHAQIGSLLKSHRLSLAFAKKEFLEHIYFRIPALFLEDIDCSEKTQSLSMGIQALIEEISNAKINWKDFSILKPGMLLKEIDSCGNQELKACGEILREKIFSHLSESLDTMMKDKNTDVSDKVELCRQLQEALQHLQPENISKLQANVIKAGQALENLNSSLVVRVEELKKLIAKPILAESDISSILEHLQSFKSYQEALDSIYGMLKKENMRLVAIIIHSCTTNISSVRSSTVGNFSSGGTMSISNTLQMWRKSFQLCFLLDIVSPQVASEDSENNVRSYRAQFETATDKLREYTHSLVTNFINKANKPVALDNIYELLVADTSVTLSSGSTDTDIDFSHATHKSLFICEEITHHLTGLITAVETAISSAAAFGAFDEMDLNMFVSLDANHIAQTTETFSRWEGIKSTISKWATFLALDPLFEVHFKKLNTLLIPIDSRVFLNGFVNMIIRLKDLLISFQVDDTSESGTLLKMTVLFEGVRKVRQLSNQLSTLLLDRVGRDIASVASELFSKISNKYSAVVQDFISEIEVLCDLSTSVSALPDMRQRFHKLRLNYQIVVNLEKANNQIVPAPASTSAHTAAETATSAPASSSTGALLALGDTRQILSTVMECVEAKTNHLCSAIFTIAHDIIIHFDKLTPLFLELGYLYSQLPTFYAKYIDQRTRALLEELGKIDGLILRLGSVLRSEERTGIALGLLKHHPLIESQSQILRRERTDKQDNIQYMLWDEKTRKSRMTGNYFPRVDPANIENHVLARCFSTFQNRYYGYVDTITASIVKCTGNQQPDVSMFLNNIRTLLDHFRPRTTDTHYIDQILFSKEAEKFVPAMLAEIASVWSALYSKGYFQATGGGKDSILRPNVSQILGIFRIFGIGYDAQESDSTLYQNTMKLLDMFWTTVKKTSPPVNSRIRDRKVNNLAQVLTGEGKSIVLGFSAALFALMGKAYGSDNSRGTASQYSVEVCVSCYNKYLTKRDSLEMRPLFDALGIFTDERQESVVQPIRYLTFNQMCEAIIDRKVDLRNTVKDMFQRNSDVPRFNGASSSTAADATRKPRRKVLLIDEADVFLSDSFYGKLYHPSILVQGPEVHAFLRAVWGLRSSNIQNLEPVRNLPEYAALKARYSSFEHILDDVIKEMVHAFITFKTPTNAILAGEDLLEQDSDTTVSSNLLLGPASIWNYFFYEENGKISRRKVEEKTGLPIHCGAFSFAEIPKEFDFISGVTGTLDSLAESQKAILYSVYNIQSFTFIPTVFPSRILKDEGLHYYATEEKLFEEIQKQIIRIQTAERAILIVFKDKEALDRFYQLPEMEALRSSGCLQTCHEGHEFDDRTQVVENATQPRIVTLTTRSFGRGTDFICRNRDVEKNGGLHVVQTFFSSEVAEERQIKGRTARQGEQGSYMMMLLQQELQEMMTAEQWRNIQTDRAGAYNKFNKIRNDKFEVDCSVKSRGILECEKDHKESRAFLNSLLQKNSVEIQKFLYEQNKSFVRFATNSRTLILLDGTGSMGSMLTQVKTTISRVFLRAHECLLEAARQKRPNCTAADISFEICVAIYRDYDCHAHYIFEPSPWKSDPKELFTFLEGQVARGGGGNGGEAIEVGLDFAYREALSDKGLAQVILIGDEPANSPQSVTHCRSHFKGEHYWTSNGFPANVNVNTTLEKLASLNPRKRVTIHTLRLNDDKTVINSFNQIHGYHQDNLNRGKNFKLDYRNEEEFMAFVTTHVMSRAADGDEALVAIEEYGKRYFRTAHL